MTIAPREPVQLHHRMGACGAAFLQVLESLVAGGRGGDAAHLQAVLRRLAGGAHPGEPGCGGGGGGGSPKAGARHPDVAVLVSLLLQLRVRTRILTRRSHAVTTLNSCRSARHAAPQAARHGLALALMWGQNRGSMHRPLERSAAAET